MYTYNLVVTTELKKKQTTNKQNTHTHTWKQTQVIMILSDVATTGHPQAEGMGRGWGWGGEVLIVSVTIWILYNEAGETHRLLRYMNITRGEGMGGGGGSTHCLSHYMNITQWGGEGEGRVLIVSFTIQISHNVRVEWLQSGSEINNVRDHQQDHNSKTKHRPVTAHDQLSCRW